MGCGLQTAAGDGQHVDESRGGWRDGVLRRAAAEASDGARTLQGCDAALDPIAESETYEMFYNLSGEKTAVFISHRLASTRFCDRVIFLENGKVKAEGSHEELLEQCPEYEKMYRVQSHYYRKEAVI